MRLLFINPNATDSMTTAIGDAARLAVPEATIVARTNRSGPASIQGEADGAAAVPGLLAEIAAASGEAFDAMVIACFDDTGRDAAREAAPCPVIGIGEAAFHAATLVGRRFSVVTTLPVSVPIIERNIAAYGFGPACVRVRASGVPVLAVEAAEAEIAAEAARADAEDGIDSLVLGCAGMAGLAERLADRLGLPVIDGVAAAARLAALAGAIPGRR
jgi:allantoin racemase